MSYSVVPNSRFSISSPVSSRPARFLPKRNLPVPCLQRVPDLDVIGGSVLIDGKPVHRILKDAFKARPDLYARLAQEKQITLRRERGKLLRKNRVPGLQRSFILKTSDDGIQWVAKEHGVALQGSKRIKIKGRLRAISQRPGVWEVEKAVAYKSLGRGDFGGIPLDLRISLFRSLDPNGRYLLGPDSKFGGAGIAKRAETDLFEYCMKKTSPEEEKIRIILEVAEALQFLHLPRKDGSRFAHRDISMENVLLLRDRKDGLLHARLGDLETLCNDAVSHAQGKTLYMSDAVLVDRNFSLEAQRLSDIFSFKLIYHEVLTGAFLWDFAKPKCRSYTDNAEVVGLRKRNPNLLYNAWCNFKTSEIWKKTFTPVERKEYESFFDSLDRRSKEFQDMRSVYRFLQKMHA